MIFYEVAILKSPLNLLTYSSNTIIQVGTIVEVTIQNRKKQLLAVAIKEVEEPQFKCKEISLITQSYYDDFILESAKFISKYYVCSLGEALGTYTPFYDTVKLVQPYNSNSQVILSEEQQKAYNFLNSHNRSLLFADTGSGKTEIYIKLIEQQLKNNKQAVLLLPEISLSPQMEKRLKKVFSSNVAIWHSKITSKKKQQIIQDLLEGKVNLIAGARSALFLPYSNLGLIVVDEEHDDSYKSDQKPKLNVKDFSIYLGKKFNIQVVLGSATPSLNSFYKIPYYRLSQTYHKTQKSISYDRSDLSLNQNIVDRISNTLENKKQVIVFLPTRANFKYQICKDCGENIQCPYCSVGLSLHKNNNALQCHYCGYTQAIPKYCPSCKIGLIQNVRLGTAEVFEQLSKTFKEHTIVKFDRDSIKTQKELKRTLKEFNDHKIDILVGTQMLSKGHDYHNVTLAIVLGIDSILSMSSYRVREKALSLLLQIAGRSGRKGYGEVLIQTKNEEFFNTYLTKNDYEDFLKSELNHRDELYPPFIKIAKVVFSHSNHLIAKRELDFYVQKIINLNLDDLELVGFGESNIFKIASKYRYELLLRSKNVNNLLRVLHSIDSAIASIDMDTLL